MKKDIYGRDHRLYWLLSILSVVTTASGFVVLVRLGKNSDVRTALAFALPIIVLGWGFMAMTCPARPLKHCFGLGIFIVYLTAGVSLAFSPLIFLQNQNADIKYIWFGILIASVTVMAAVPLVTLAGRIGDKIERRWFTN